MLRGGNAEAAAELLAATLPRIVGELDVDTAHGLIHALRQGGHRDSQTLSWTGTIDSALTAGAADGRRMLVVSSPLTAVVTKLGELLLCPSTSDAYARLPKRLRSHSARAVWTLRH